MAITLNYTVDAPVAVHVSVDGDIKQAIDTAARRNKITKTQVINSILAHGLKLTGYLKERKPRGLKRA